MMSSKLFVINIVTEWHFFEITSYIELAEFEGTE